MPLGGDDRVVTQIVSLKHANAEEVKNLLTPLVSKTSVIISHAGSGMLILTDFQSNISRLVEIIRTVDVPSDGEEMLIIPLHRTSAESVSKAISQLFTAAPAQKGQRPEVVKVIPFERTNTLIVFASKASVVRVREVVPGEVVRTESIDAVALKTKPPARYTEATLLTAMEGAGKLIDDDDLRLAMEAASGPVCPGQFSGGISKSCSVSLMSVVIPSPVIFRSLVTGTYPRNW